MASPVAQALKASAYNAGDPGSIPGSGRSLEQEMATHSGTLAWTIPWTEEPDRLTESDTTEPLKTLSTRQVPGKLIFSARVDGLADWGNCICRLEERFGNVAVLE